MFLSTLGLKSDGMITEMVRAQRQSYDGAIAPVEDRRGSHLPSNKCDAEVIRLHINSYNPAITSYYSSLSFSVYYFYIMFELTQTFFLLSHVSRLPNNTTQIGN